MWSNKLLQFKNIISPFRVWQINVGPKLNDLPYSLMLWAERKNNIWVLFKQL